MKNIKFFYIIASNKNEAEKIATKLLDKKLKSYYNQIDIQFTAKNYLPAFIYTCYNQKPL